MQIWLFTSAYCKAALLAEQFEHLYKDPDMKKVIHVVIDNHYPVDKVINRQAIKTLCQLYGARYVDSWYDRGLHEGLNNAIRWVGVLSEDKFLCCDPDDRPQPGWITAMTEVMKADPLIGVLGLNFWVIPWKKEKDNVPIEEKTVAGYRVWYHPTIEMFNVVGIHTHLILNRGGLKQPNKYYGGIEIELYNSMKFYQMRLAYLPDFTSEFVPCPRDNKLLFDSEYRDWKTAHAHLGYQKSFEEYLSEKKQLC